MHKNAPFFMKKL